MHLYKNCYCKVTVFVLPVWFWPSQAKILFLYYILDCDIRVTCHRLCTCEVSIKGLLGQKLLHYCRVLFFVCCYPVNGGPQGIELFCVSSLKLCLEAIGGQMEVLDNCMLDLEEVCELLDLERRKAAQDRKLLMLKHNRE